MSRKDAEEHAEEKQIYDKKLFRREYERTPRSNVRNQEPPGKQDKSQGTAPRLAGHLAAAAQCAEPANELVSHPAAELAPAFGAELIRG
jgi:hypothetical protein